MSARCFSALFLVVAVLAGCNVGGGSDGGELVEVTRRVQRGVEPGQRTIVFDGFSGDITLQDTSAREADLTFVLHARAESRERAQRLLDDIRVEERGAEGEFAYQLSSGTASRTSVDVEGRLPQDTPLRVHLRNGDVALSGLRGPLDVSNENGNVRIGGAARATRAETRNGAVEVGLQGVEPESEVRLRTSNGDVKLTLPGTASAEIDARTQVGSVDLRGLDFADRNLARSGAGARFEGQLGNGGTEIRLRTENGNVTLEEGTVRRLPSMAGDTSRSAPRDTTGQDTTGLDSIFAPPPSSQQQNGSTQRDTSSLLGPSSPGQRNRSQGSTRQQRPSQQQGTPYSDGPPPLLRRPPRSQTADTSRVPSATVPGVPSLRNDTTQMY